MRSKLATLLTELVRLGEDLDAYLRNTPQWHMKIVAAAHRKAASRAAHPAVKGIRVRTAQKAFSQSTYARQNRLGSRWGLRRDFYAGMKVERIASKHGLDIDTVRRAIQGAKVRKSKYIKKEKTNVIS
jgi:hypothetical protein